MIRDQHIERMPRGDAIARVRIAARHRRAAIARAEADPGLDDATRQRRIARNVRRLRKVQGVARRAGIDANGPSP